MDLPDPPIPPGLPEPPSAAGPHGYRPPRRRPWLRFGPADTHRGATSVAWFALGGVLAVITVLWGTLQTVGVLAHDERPLPRIVAAAGAERVEVRSQGGRVDLVAATGDRVVVSGTVSDGLVATDVSIATEGDTVRVRVACSWAAGPWCRADLRIEVPAGMAVRLDTDHGRITADGLTGELVVRSDAASVRGTDLRSAAVDVVSGAGRVRLGFAAPPRRVEATTDIGGVVVEVPDDDATYRVDATSDAGRARVEVRTDPLATRTIAVTSGTGDAVVRYRDPAG